MNDSTPPPMYTQLPLFDEPRRKQCPQCREEYPLTAEFFHHAKGEASGFHSWCKFCHNARRRERQQENPEHCREVSQRYREQNLDKVKQKEKEYRQRNRETIRQQQKEYRETHREQLLKHREVTRDQKNERSRQRYAENLEGERERSKRYQQANPEKSRERGRRYVERHQEELRRRAVENYHANRDRYVNNLRERRKDNPEYYREKARRWRQNSPEKVRANSNRRRARKMTAEGSHTGEEIKALYTQQRGLCFHCGVDLSTGYHEDHWIPLSKGGSNWISNIRLLCRPCNLSKGAKLPHEWDSRYAPSV